MNKRLASLPAVLTILCCFVSCAVEDLVTIRVGEQDSCDVTGVTKVGKYNAKSKRGTITFDLSAQKQIKGVEEAALCMWVKPGKYGFEGAPFSAERWKDPGFDGFKVWLPTKTNEALDTAYPFSGAAWALLRFDVTDAVRGWIRDPESNKGLATNFPFTLKHTFAWHKPYLQITYRGNGKPPAQATQLKARFRHGQVFLTWKQNEQYQGAFFDHAYRIYASYAPITAASLGKASLLGEVHCRSQLDYRRTLHAWTGWGAFGRYTFYPLMLRYGLDWDAKTTKQKKQQDLLSQIPERINYCIEHDWAEKQGILTDPGKIEDGYTKLEGPQLSNDTGLFVHTVRKAGDLFFAVTTVLEGYENSGQISAQNSLAQPVAVKVEPTKPVLQVVYSAKGKIDPKWDKTRRYRTVGGGPMRDVSHPWQHREYIRWGGGKGDPLGPEPSTPFHYFDRPPMSFIGGGKPNPRHGAVSVCYWNCFHKSVNVDTYLPPTRLAPFPPLSTLDINGGLDWPHRWKWYYATNKKPTGPGRETGVGKSMRSRSGGSFGNATGFGYHDAMNMGTDPRKATIVPYGENLVITATKDYLEMYPRADRNRITPSMDGDTSLLGIHHSDLFCTIGATMAAPASAPVKAGNYAAWGLKAWKLKLANGHSVWDWNDHIWFSKQFPKKVWPFFCHVQSPNYSAGDNKTFWEDFGYPKFYEDLEKEKRGGYLWWVTIGDAPDAKAPLVPMNQAYPTFTNVNFAERPQKVWAKEPRGSLNGYLTWYRPGAPKNEWSRKPAKTPVSRDLVDQSDRFEMAIRIHKQGLVQNGRSVDPTKANFGATDITLWRIQAFKVDAGKPYTWINKKVKTGQVLQSGVVKADQRDLLTIPGFFVDRDLSGNKLIITRDGSANSVENGEKIDVAFARRLVQDGIMELTFTEYAKRCANPVLAEPIKLPETTFQRNYSVPGGAFTRRLDNTVRIGKPGYYVVSLKAKAKRGLSWGVVGVGMRRAVEMSGRAVVESEAWQTFHWVVKAEEGKLDYQLVVPGEHYFPGTLDKNLLSKKRTTVGDLTFRYVPEGKLDQPAFLRVTPNAGTLLQGSPMKLSAELINGKGAAIQVPVEWSATGGSIDSNGVLRASDEKVTVTAKSGSVSAAAVFRTAKEFRDDFNEGNGGLKSCWGSVDFSKSKGRWYPPTGGNMGLLTSLNQNTSLSTGVRTALIWQPGARMTDAAIEADWILPAIGKTPRTFKNKAYPHGLVLRSDGAKSHYRFQVERTSTSSVARIILRNNGKETELAKTTVDEIANQDRAHPEFPGSRKPGGPHKLDRMKFTAKGSRLSAWLNGKQVFDGVENKELKKGSPGLYDTSKSVWDNVTISVGD